MLIKSELHVRVSFTCLEKNTARQSVAASKQSGTASLLTSTKNKRGAEGDQFRYRILIFDHPQHRSVFGAIPDVLVISEQSVMIRFHLCPSHNGCAFQELMALHAFDRYFRHDAESTESNLLAIDSTA